MTIHDTIGVYDQTEFADNPEARCPIVLILDVSESMEGAKIDTVNEALVKFQEMIREDSVTALRADIAVIAFTYTARVVQDFVNGTDFEAPVLYCSNPKDRATYAQYRETGLLDLYTRRGKLLSGTVFSAAVNEALDIIEARKQSYRDGGIAYYRGLAYFLTDGLPVGDYPGPLAQAAQRLAAAEENRSVAFFSFIINGDDGIPEWGVDGDKLDDFFKLIGISDEELTAAGAFGSGAEGARGLNLYRVAELVDASMPDIIERCVSAGIMRTAVGELSRLAPRPPVVLNNMAQLEGSIQWLSRSVAAVSQSQPGESIRLPQPDYLNF